jgi:CRP-like cAMP-binding protein
MWIKSANIVEVLRENDPCPGMYVVGQGLVRVFKTNPGGKEHVLHTADCPQSFPRPSNQEIR